MNSEKEKAGEIPAGSRPKRDASSNPNAIVLRRRALLSLAPALWSLAAASPARERVAMRVGTVNESYRVWKIKPGGRRILDLPARKDEGAALLRIVIPDDRESHAYRFEILSGDRILSRRGGTTRGFGPRSFFLPLPSSKAKERLTLRNLADEPLDLESCRWIPASLKSSASNSSAPGDFILSLLVNGEAPELFPMLARLHDAPGVRKAFSEEVYYAARSPESLAESMDKAKAAADRYNLGFVAIPCSWWAGTPPEVRQRLDFQQICWSETDAYDEGEGLRKLLGSKWDIRYGLTIPNVWSDTPWQTMNSPELNALRQIRMKEVVRLIEAKMKGSLAAYVSENEPAYWAGGFPDGHYPVKREKLLADFNPSTVAAAKADGVDLDPRDGLSLKARIWLLQNLANYMQANVKTIRSAGASQMVYSHALLAQMYPIEGTGRFRPYADAARVKDAAIGLETLWKTDMDGLWRVRDRGAWACVNREENDGMGLDFHVAMLEATYMMGADLFNSYNWNAINQDDRAIGYFNEFLDRLKSGGVAIAGEREDSGEWRPVGEWEGPLAVAPALPWANHLEISIRPGASNAPLRVELTNGKGGPTVAYRLVAPSEASAKGATDLDFGDLARMEQGDAPYLSLSGSGWEYYGASDGPNYRLTCHLKEERERSRRIMRGARGWEDEESKN